MTRIDWFVVWWIGFTFFVVLFVLCTAEYLTSEERRVQRKRDRER